MLRPTAPHISGQPKFHTCILHLDPILTNTYRDDASLRTTDHLALALALALILSLTPAPTLTLALALALILNLNLILTLARALTLTLALGPPLPPACAPPGFEDKMIVTRPARPDITAPVAYTCHA